MNPKTKMVLTYADKVHVEELLREKPKTPTCSDGREAGDCLELDLTTLVWKVVPYRARIRIKKVRR